MFKTRVIFLITPLIMEYMYAVSKLQQYANNVLCYL